MVYINTPPLQDHSALIRNNLYLVDILVGRMVTQVPAFMNRDDMRSAGMLGLIDATNKFDPGKNILFKTFAEYRIRGAILDEMRKLDWFSRSLREKQNKLSRTMIKLERKLGRSPDEEEMASEMEVSLEEYQQILGEVGHLGCVSLNETFNDSGDGASFLDCLADQRANSSPADRLENAELTKTLASILQELSEKERLVISLYYYEELTQKEIADVLEVSEGRISQLHSQALLKLKTKVQMKNGSRE